MGFTFHFLGAHISKMKEFYSKVLYVHVFYRLRDVLFHRVSTIHSILYPQSKLMEIVFCEFDFLYRRSFELVSEDGKRCRIKFQWFPSSSISSFTLFAVCAALMPQKHPWLKLMVFVCVALLNRPANSGAVNGDLI